MIKSPQITVIVPVYNVELYLKETLDSIINQTIGFKENTQLILINDGSPDNSEKICLEYRDNYPDNVVYKKQRNAGVSVARNKGLSLAKGRYIHFMDSDDVISHNFHKESINLLENNKDVDIVASKISFFDAKYAQHYLNKKFHSTRVIDVNTEPNNPIFHLPTMVFRNSTLKGHKFDSRIKISEDAKFVNEVLYHKKKYGVLKNTNYYYRRRQNETSAINTKLSNRSYYIDTPNWFIAHLMKLWQQPDGSVHQYIQNLAMIEVAWRILDEKKQDVLSDSEQDEYKSTIYSLLDQIDDELILSSKIINIQHKLHLLKKKYGEKDYHKKIICRGDRYYFNDILLYSVGDNLDSSSLVFDFIHDQGDGSYKIEGYSILPTIRPTDKRYIKTSKGLFPVKYVKRSRRQDGFLGDLFSDQDAFEVVVKVSETDRLTGVLATDEGFEIELPIFTKQFTGLGVLNHTYTIIGGRLFKKDNHSIKICESTPASHLRLEIRYNLQILRNIQLRKSISWARGTLVNLDSLFRFAPRKKIIRELAGPFILLLRSAWMGMLDVFIRQLYNFGLHKSDRPIWIISDRGSLAGDNGEALFKYIVEVAKPNVDVYFVISKKSPDFKRLQQVGRVVDLDSLKYKLLFLRADKIISSHADYYVYNTFGYRWTHFSDLYKFDFIFLQHGIIQADLSGWLNRFEKNIKLFVTSAKTEYNSILEDDYGYDKSVVKLTGLPRYDLLESKPKKTVILAPTWRKNILPEERHGKSGVRAHSDTFKDTEYFKFYNNLMNDSRLIDALNTKGMTGEFYLHPAFSRQVGDFSSNSSFTIKTPPYDYKQAFREGDLMITDYSSVAFDFAYLRKPVIYTQFDNATLHENHIAEEGYFSYEDDGMGVVTYNYESAVDEIVRTIKSGCKLSDKYAARIDKFYKYNDRENSRRVYEEIINQ